MTSQLILANGHGIALASDSAVTMGSRRTFETSEKVYPLPLPHRLAVLHSGSVMFHGLPFGTIINEWILSLGNVQLRSVPLYVDNFKSWLQDNYLNWTNDKDLCDDMLNAFYFDFQRIWNRMKRLENPMDHAAIMEIWETEILSAESFSEASASERKIAETEFQRLWNDGNFSSLCIQESFEYWFDDVAESDEIVALAKKYVLTSIQSRYPGSDDGVSQLIFVGYGSKDLLPSHSSVYTYGAISKILYLIESSVGLAYREGNGVYLIKPSGQFDAIDLFFRGYGSGFIEATKTAVSKALENVSVKDPIENEAMPDSPMNSIGSLIENSFFDYSESTKLAGLRRTVAGMPLASLVRTARHLIGIQRLSLEIAGELQTVGGQIDVGTITLKDGFTWIHQKDYTDFVD